MTTTPRTNRSVLRDQRGSIMVEFLIMVPFLTMIWVFMHFIWQFSTASQQNQRGIRECAWADTWAACDGPQPPTCSDGAGAVNMQGPSEVDGGELKGKISSADKVTSSIPSIKDSFETGKLHGKSRSYDRKTSRTRPTLLGGSISISGGFQTMCNTMKDDVGEKPENQLNPLREHELDPVFKDACKKILKSSWCP
jgi:hypothetical protein